MNAQSTSASQSPSVAVVGGGLAGLATACALADNGFTVTLFERRPFLGGRASSYEHPGTGEIVDNCQHVLFGVCTNLMEFYGRLGATNKIRWFDEMNFIEPGGRASVLRSTSLPAPFQTLPSFASFPFLNVRDKLAIARAMMSLVPFPAKDNGESFLVWLQRHGQTSAAIERFWNPILISALSDDLDRISISAAGQVIRETTRSNAARRMGIPAVPLTELYAAAESYITQRGGKVQLRCSVTGVEPAVDSVALNFANGSQRFDFAVLALPFFALAPVLPADDASTPLRNQIAKFENSPITGIHLWFDRQISDLEHAVLLDRTIQWMFHKSKLLNKTSEGSYVELVVSASKSLIAKSKQEIVDMALQEMREFFPEARSAQLLKSTVIKEVNATYSPRPGIDAHRPGHTTPWPHIFLAGDWTATGWPATMEGAVRSGYMAAEALMQSVGKKKALIVPDLPATGFMRLFPG